MLLADCGQAGAVVKTVSQTDPNRPLAFEPARLEVPLGTTARWRNDDGAFHTLTLRNGAFTEPLFVRGNTVRYTFDHPGTYEYSCQPHQDFMESAIIVR